MDVTVEMARIALRAGKTESDLMTASRVFQRDFLNHQPGFLRRELLRLSEGSYVDLVHWRSATDAAVIMDKAAKSDVCGAFSSLMEMDTGNPAEGVTHFTSLASYP